ncbi:hypothetical protein FQN57_007169 [Myotisia sp. PD_48]|nr:hypothetical protein FQN57_007169 [Myotisia sp. PD_48]
MNPSNFSAHTGAMASSDTSTPQMPPQKIEHSQMLLSHVAQALQAQGPFTGWRESVPVEERAIKVRQMISSIRLIKPNFEIANAITWALRFEEKAFTTAKEKFLPPPLPLSMADPPLQADYDREFAERLSKLRDSRQQRAMMQGGMIPRANPGNNMPINPQAQMQPMFAAQMGQRPMQGSPVNMPHQPHGMKMNIPHQQVPVTQHQFPPPGAPQESNAMTAAEYEHICRLAEQMARKTLPADMEKIKLNLQNMSPEQRQQLALKGIEPLEYFFRSEAFKELRRQRMQRMEMVARAQASNNVDPATSMSTDPSNPHQRQLSQSMMGHQNTAGIPITQPGFDNNFLGNVDHIQGQQAEGLRSQEAGQIVVPATTTPQMLNHQFPAQTGMFPGGQQNFNRPGMNPAMMAQRQQPPQQSPHTAQHNKLPQQTTFQSQAVAQARADVAAKARMAMSQVTPQIQQQPMNQGPAVNMGNRSRGPGQAPQTGGPQASMPTSIGQNQPTVRPQLPPGLPPAIQHQLSQLPPEQVVAFLQNYSRQLRSPGMVRPNQPPGQMLPQYTNSTGQPQQPQGPQFMGDPNMRSSVAVQQHLMGMGGMLPQLQGGIPGQPMPMQKPNQFPQNENLPMQYMRQQKSMELTDDQIREMDRVPFPHALINANTSISPKPTFPPNVGTWGQLKMWASQNPQMLGDMSLPKLQGLQKLHFQSIQRELANRQAQNANSQSGLPPNVVGQQRFAPQQPQRGSLQHGQHPLNSAMRPVTAQEIQFARGRMGPQHVKFSDEHVKQLLIKTRQNQLLQVRNNMQAASQLNQQPPTIQMSGVEFSQAQPQQTQSILASPMQPAMPQAASQPSSTLVSTPQPVAKPQRVTAAKPAVKSLKRPSPSDAEVKNGAAEPQLAQAGPQLGTNAGMSQPTAAQIAAMSPQQKARYEALLRQSQQPAQPRQPVTREMAETSWALLPEHIKKIYDEIVRHDSSNVPIPMPPEHKAAMSQQLRDSTDMLGRMDALVRWVSGFREQEKSLRTLLQMRMLLMKQFKGPDWTLNDQFTISQESVTSSISYIRKWFSVISRAAQGSRQSATNRTGPPALAHQAQLQGSTPLNASNLHQHEQQEAAIKRAKRAQAVPPAPTTLQPPFPIGTTSPHGVPHAYGPAQVTKDNLVLPDKKKRKKDQPIIEPATKAKRPSTQAKMTVAKKAPIPPKESFKCSTTSCPHHTKGFATQALLDEHVQEHHTEEPITDPVEFLLESYRIGLGLAQPSTDGTKIKGATTSQPAPEKATPNTSSQAIRGISKPDIGSSLSSIQAKPSQANGLKPAPNNTKKADNVTVGTATPRPSVKEAWDRCPISPEMIRSAFGDLGDETSCGLGVDPVDELLSGAAFTNMRSRESPPSTDTAPNTVTPLDTEESKEIEKDFRIFDSDESWIPADWVNLPGDLEGTLLNEPWEEINWDLVDMDGTATNDKRSYIL